MSDAPKLVMFRTRVVEEGGDFFVCVDVIGPPIDGVPHNQRFRFYTRSQAERAAHDFMEMNRAAGAFDVPEGPLN